jgi:hypothetical protein
MSNPRAQYVADIYDYEGTMTKELMASYELEQKLVNDETVLWSY